MGFIGHLGNAAGRPLITRDSPAARELLTEGPGITLVPPADPEALADAVRSHLAVPPTPPPGGWHAQLKPVIEPAGIGATLRAVLIDLARRESRRAYRG